MSGGALAITFDFILPAQFQQASSAWRLGAADACCAALAIHAAWQQPIACCLLCRRRHVRASWHQLQGRPAEPIQPAFHSSWHSVTSLMASSRCGLGGGDTVGCLVMKHSKAQQLG